jgi:prepilin-type N-terminal cleavage/methylation domain-containing protein
MKAINKTQQGFTLVELIIVIVILGILAVTAAPRFLNFTSDARKSVVSGVEGALKASLSIINGKAQIQGKANSVPTAAGDLDTISVDGIKVTYGYPKATAAQLKLAIEFPTGWVTSAEATDTAVAGLIDDALDAGDDYMATAGKIRIAADTASPLDNGCYVEYTASSKAAAADPAKLPTVTVETDGCK